MQNKNDFYSRVKQNMSEYFDEFNGNLITSPAGIVLLGDHTHYTEGILLAGAVDMYTAIAVQKRNDNHFRLVIHNENEYSFTLDNIEVVTKYVKAALITEILKIMKSEDLISTGLDCYIETEIPHCIGLGYYSALIMGYIYALNQELKLNLTNEKMVEIGFEAQKSKIGKIANKATLYATLTTQKNVLQFYDLRKKVPVNTDALSKQYKVVIFDTGEAIHEPQNICNERIEECEIGVKGLKLYVWGIKNLRDIKPDFLEKHIHMLPRRVYNRCLYNVNERIRVQNAADSIYNEHYEDLGNFIFDSHVDLANLYEISTDKLDYVVEESLNSGLVGGAKVVSCSSYRSVLSLIEEKNVDKAIELISEKYKEKFEGTLITYRLDFCNGLTNNNK